MSLDCCWNFTCSKSTSKAIFYWTQSCHPQSSVIFSFLIRFLHFKLSAMYCLLSIFLFFPNLQLFFHLTQVKAFAAQTSLLPIETYQVLQIPKTLCSLRDNKNKLWRYATPLQEEIYNLGITIHYKDFTQSGLALCFAPILCEIFSKILDESSSEVGKQSVEQRLAHKYYLDFRKTFSIPVTMFMLGKEMLWLVWI